MTKLPAAVVTATLLALTGCSEKAPRGGVPLPIAYHRIATYDSAYRAVDSLPVRLLVNSAASVANRPAPDGATFVDISYPAYRATLHLTLTPITSEAQRAEAIDNRIERMSLNTGGADSELADYTTSGGYSARMLTTPAGTPTPIQLLADGPRWLVSGALALSDVPRSADSIAPVLDAIRADMITLLDSLR